MRTIGEIGARMSGIGGTADIELPGQKTGRVLTPARALGTGLTAMAATLIPAAAFAQDAVPTMDKGDTVWMMVATALVLFMLMPGLALFYGGLVRIATDARLDDGLLDLNVFSGTGFGDSIRTVLGVVTGLHVRDPRHSFYRGRTIRIETEKPMAVHLDGEPHGTTPLFCQVVPRSLSVLIPRHIRPELFAEKA